MIRGMRIFRETRALLSRATVLYALGTLVPAMLLAALAFARANYVNLIMPWLIVYELICLASLILLLMARSMVSDYSLKNAQLILRVTGVLGLFTALIIGGVVVLRASRLISGFEVSERRESLKRGYSSKAQSDRNDRSSSSDS